MGNCSLTWPYAWFGYYRNSQCMTLSRLEPVLG